MLVIMQNIILKGVGGGEAKLYSIFVFDFKYRITNGSLFCWGFFVVGVVFLHLNNRNQTKYFLIPRQNCHVCLALTKKKFKIKNK